jgi:hypothetical protein
VFDDLDTTALLYILTYVRYSTSWAVDYNVANHGAKQTLAQELLHVSKNYYCIAQDLVDCNLPQNNVIRSKLQLLIRAFFESALEFYRTNHNSNPTVAPLVTLFDRLNSRLAAIAIELIRLGEDFDQSLPGTNPPQAGFWLLPNAQPLELLVAAVLETITGPNSNLGK